MKKLFFLAAALFITVSASAQNDSKIRLGLKAGLNISNIIKDDGNNNFNTDYLVGFNGGVTLDIPIVDRLAFSPELLYSTKGYKADAPFGTFTQTTHFIDAPLLARINLAGGLNLIAGPQVSFLLSTNNKYENSLGSIERQIDEDSDRFRKSLVGGVIGFRYDINQQFDIHGRYALDFQKNNEDGTSRTPEFRNQVFQVGIGVKF
ncbi:porin family protein [Pedobacter sp. SYP-B3415]|uniref:porin family protein n=1 Tax=Pedobacter sp. SYP-B3415 TaxID=2496641 RepID=UPI00101DE2ED|nr:porin family protein [Pedobacter sp. SYP-B3415]